MVSYTATCKRDEQPLGRAHYSDNDTLTFLFFSVNGLKQMWYLVAHLYSLSCDLVSGAIGFSGKELYSLLASEFMWAQNLLTQSGPSILGERVGYISISEVGIDAPSR